MSYSIESRPTRLNLLRSRRRLERVREGADLLRRKREALVRELLRHARPAVDERERIGRAARVAYPALVDALAAEGADGVMVGAEPLPEVRLEMRSDRVWGLSVASVAAPPRLERTMEGRGTAPGATEPSTIEARRGLRDARSAPPRGGPEGDATSPARSRGCPIVPPGPGTRAEGGARAGVGRREDDEPPRRARARGASATPSLPQTASTRTTIEDGGGPTKAAPAPDLRPPTRGCFMIETMRSLPSLMPDPYFYLSPSGVEGNLLTPRHSWIAPFFTCERTRIERDRPDGRGEAGHGKIM